MYGGLTLQPNDAARQLERARGGETADAVAGGASDLADIGWTQVTWVLGAMRHKLVAAAAPIRVEAVDDPAAALARACSIDERVVAAGSIFLIGPLRDILRGFRPQP